MPDNETERLKDELAALDQLVDDRLALVARENLKLRLLERIADALERSAGVAEERR